MGSKYYRAKKRVVDMSLPPEQRHRKKKNRKTRGKGTIAQMDHACGKSEVNKKRRTWEKKNKR